MDLNELRGEIDTIDDQLVRLFCQRMEVAARISDYKKEHGLPVFAPAREREKLVAVARKAGPHLANDTRVLYSMLFELSRSYQNRRNAHCTEQFRRITHAIEHTPRLFPKQVMTACLGEEGSDSQIVCDKLLREPVILFFRNLDGVLGAVGQGLCRYGILPLESRTPMREVYDLASRQGLFIVRAFRMPCGPDPARFLCVGKELEIYPGADRTSLILTLSGKPGSLYKVMARLYNLGINVLTLESAPVIPSREGQIVFYLDLESSVYSDEFAHLICDLGDLCEECRYLGSYSEVM